MSNYEIPALATVFTGLSFVIIALDTAVKYIFVSYVTL